MKFLKLLGYNKDELQKKVSCFHIRNMLDAERRILPVETISEYLFVGSINTYTSILPPEGSLFPRKIRQGS